MKEKEYLILVDDRDRPWGKLEKMETHKLGILHRAFSVFIFNSNGEMLLQQRADSKYHSPGLWTNACCSHPNWGEFLGDAVERRLMQEMGMMAETSPAFSFIYKVKFDNGLTEHEFDHVFIGYSDETPLPDPAEVKDWKYMDTHSLSLDLIRDPEHYTEWFRIAFPKVMDHLHRMNNSDTANSTLNKVSA